MVCYSIINSVLYRTGALRARLVRLVQSAKVEKTRGLVKSFKESFGFIERADIVGDVSTEVQLLLLLIYV